MSFKIYRARSQNDFENIRDLHCEIFDGGLEEVPEFKGAWWLAYYKNTPVGFCGMHLSGNYTHTAYLCRAGIKYYYRGYGLQKKLIRVREKWARRHKLKCIVTDTSTDNPASSNSLIHCGYKLWTPPDKIQWAEYSPAIYWRKFLK